MKSRSTNQRSAAVVADPAEGSHSELLILSDGRILVHNLTPAFADLLHELNPKETGIAGRTRRSTRRASLTKSHELPD